MIHRSPKQGNRVKAIVGQPFQMRFTGVKFHKDDRITLTRHKCVVKR